MNILEIFKSNAFSWTSIVAMSVFLTYKLARAIINVVASKNIKYKNNDELAKWIDIRVNGKLERIEENVEKLSKSVEDLSKNVKEIKKNAKKTKEK